MTSVAGQTTSELGGHWSVLVRQKRDHARLERLLQEVGVTSGADREQVLNRIYRLVFTHAFAEEAVLWPTLRRSVPDGEGLTTRVEREHQEITETVARLEATPADDPGHTQLLERTIALLRQDVRDEEDELLPRLQQALSGRELRRVGLLWELVRRTAPTRAHPIVSRRPPGNALAAVPLSVLDRARDGVDHLARRAPGAERRLRVVAEGLGAAARRVEHLPPLRKGERAETHRSQ